MADTLFAKCIELVDQNAEEFSRVSEFLKTDREARRMVQTCLRVPKMDLPISQIIKVPLPPIDPSSSSSSSIFARNEGLDLDDIETDDNHTDDNHTDDNHTDDNHTDDNHGVEVIDDVDDVDDDEDDDKE